jgi:hypothetical protein
MGKITRRYRVTGLTSCHDACDAAIDPTLPRYGTDLSATTIHVAAIGPVLRPDGTDLMPVRCVRSFPHHGNLYL